MKRTLKSTEELGAVIRAVRKNAGVRIDDLASIVGVSKQTTGNLETGKPTVALGTLFRHLDELGIKLTVEYPDAADERYQRLMGYEPTEASAQDYETRQNAMTSVTPELLQRLALSFPQIGESLSKLRLTDSTARNLEVLGLEQQIAKYTADRKALAKAVTKHKEAVQALATRKSAAHSVAKARAKRKSNFQVWNKARIKRKSDVQTSLTQAFGNFPSDVPTTPKLFFWKNEASAPGVESPSKHEYSFTKIDGEHPGAEKLTQAARESKSQLQKTKK